MVNSNDSALQEHIQQKNKVKYGNVLVPSTNPSYVDLGGGWGGGGDS